MTFPTKQILANINIIGTQFPLLDPDQFITDLLDILDRQQHPNKYKKPTKNDYIIFTPLHLTQPLALIYDTKNKQIFIQRINTPPYLYNKPNFLSNKDITKKLNKINKLFPNINLTHHTTKFNHKEMKGVKGTLHHITIPKLSNHNTTTIETILTLYNHQILNIDNYI